MTEHMAHSRHGVCEAEKAADSGPVLGGTGTEAVARGIPWHSFAWLWPLSLGENTSKKTRGK